MTALKEGISVAPARRPHLEAVPSPETKSAEDFVTPRVSRVLFSTTDPNLLNPQNTPEQSHVEDLAKKTHKDIDYGQIELQSTQSRETYWEKIGNGQSYGKQVETWNQKISDWLLEFHNRADQDENRERTLKSLGLTTDPNVENSFTKKQVEISYIDTDNNEKIEKIETFSQVEDFRKKYFDGKSDIKQFVSDIAEDCRDEKGTVDLATLEKRLNSVQELLGAFGTETTIHDHIKDYTMSYGLLSRTDEAEKRRIAEKAQREIGNLGEDDQKNFKKLFEVTKREITIDSGSSFSAAPTSEEDEEVPVIEEEKDETDDSKETTQENDGQPLSPAEAINGITEGLTSALPKIAEVMDEQKRLFTEASRLLGRALTNKELNIITHGGTSEDVVENRKQELAAGFEEVKKQIEINQEANPDKSASTGLSLESLEVVTLALEVLNIPSEEKEKITKQLDAKYKIFQENGLNPQYQIWLQREKQSDGDNYKNNYRAVPDMNKFHALPPEKQEEIKGKIKEINEQGTTIQPTAESETSTESTETISDERKTELEELVRNAVLNTPTVRRVSTLLEQYGQIKEEDSDESENDLEEIDNELRKGIFTVNSLDELEFALHQFTLSYRDKVEPETTQRILYRARQKYEQDYSEHPEQKPLGINIYPEYNEEGKLDLLSDYKIPESEKPVESEEPEEIFTHEGHEAKVEEAISEHDEHEQNKREAAEDAIEESDKFPDYKPIKKDEEVEETTSSTDTLEEELPVEQPTTPAELTPGPSASMLNISKGTEEQGNNTLADYEADEEPDEHVERLLRGLNLDEDNGQRGWRGRNRGIQGQRRQRGRPNSIRKWDDED